MKLIKEKVEDKQIDLWFNQMLKDSYVMEEILDKIDKNYANYDFGNFEFYADRGDATSLVINVKGRGYPRKLANALEKEMIKNYPKLKNFTDEVEVGVEKYMESSFDSLFWDSVSFEVENMELEDFYFVVVGRSGGYWGITLDSFEQKVKWTINKKGIKKLEKLKEEYIKGLNEEDTLDSYDDFIDDFLYETNYADSLELDDFDIDKETQKALDDVEKRIEETVKWFESNEKWIEDFDANNYWEDILDYIDIDLTGEE